MSTQWSEKVLQFWYEELEPQQWFKSPPEIDEKISKEFGGLLRDLACKQDLAVTSPRETLAAVIVLDQFSRTIHRGTAQAFATDSKALALTKSLISSGKDKELGEMERHFLYMPLMHSENLADQKTCLNLYEEMGSENGVHWAKDHLQVIEKFGRFPHRNKVLGRVNTPEEDEYLKTANTYGQ